MPSAPTGTYASLGCEVNTLSPEALYAHYERSRFLYPEKKARLTPCLPLILQNWRRMWDAGEALQRVVTCRSPHGGLAAMTMWCSTGTCWHAQHLVNSGPPQAARAVMLAAQAETMREGRIDILQTWFRPDHPYAARTFRTIGQVLPPGTSSVIPGDYLMVPLTVACSLATPQDRAVSAVREITGGEHSPALVSLASRTRGNLYAHAEALAEDDLLLESVDRLYRPAGLRRRRRIWVQPAPGGGLSAAALAYEGPLGLNLSFLENRLDLLIDPALGSVHAARTVRTLLSRACAAYKSFPPAAIPVMTDGITGRFLRASGAEPVAPYSQAIWHANGYGAWYRHIEDLYRRLRDSAERHGDGP
ncbi:hypothetical protein AB0B50_02820 [Streptomyces sp. NPDC041068]|uniref:hypothetical protein n=1 Tax=Streptomyces sp. NPDC041068 TaxID=3155130 RepID=UPI00341106B7